MARSEPGLDFLLPSRNVEMFVFEKKIVICEYLADYRSCLAFSAPQRVATSDSGSLLKNGRPRAFLLFERLFATRSRDPAISQIVIVRRKRYKVEAQRTAWFIYRTCARARAQSHSPSQPQLPSSALLASTARNTRVSDVQNTLS